MISNDDVIRLAKWHENEAVRMVKHPDSLAEMCGLAEIHGETASALYMLLAERDAAIVDADMQAREAGNMEHNARVLMAERDQLKESHDRAMVALDKALARLNEIEQLNAKAAKVVNQCHSALSVLALGTVGSHVAQRALRNIEEGLKE